MRVFDHTTKQMRDATTEDHQSIARFHQEQAAMQHHWVHRLEDEIANLKQEIAELKAKRQ